MAQEEIFGPVLVAMTFRTPDEAVALANNTRYGLAASVWSENINLALDIAPQAQGRRRLGQLDQPLRRRARASAATANRASAARAAARACSTISSPAWTKAAKPRRRGDRRRSRPRPSSSAGGIDRTAKLYHRRQAGAAGRRLFAAGRSRRKGKLVGEVGDGNRKDIRNAVEAARKAPKAGRRPPPTTARRSSTTSPKTSSARATNSPTGSSRMTASSRQSRRREVDAAIERLFAYGAWADKYRGRACIAPPFRGVALAMNEPIGVVGMRLPGRAAAARLRLADGAGDRHGQPRRRRARASAPAVATDFYQVLDTSDVPAGVVNIVTGAPSAVWPRRSPSTTTSMPSGISATRPRAQLTERAVGRQPQAHLVRPRPRHRLATIPRQARAEIFLRHAVQVKNIWIPYGE